MKLNNNTLLLVKLIANAIKSNIKNRKSEYFINKKWTMAGTIDEILDFIKGKFLKKEIKRTFKLNIWDLGIHSLIKTLRLAIEENLITKTFCKKVNNKFAFAYSLNFEEIENKYGLRFDSNYNYFPVDVNNTQETELNECSFEDKITKIVSSIIEKIQTNYLQNIFSRNTSESVQSSIESTNSSKNESEFLHYNIKGKVKEKPSAEELEAIVIKAVDDYLEVYGTEFKHKDRLIANCKVIMQNQIDDMKNTNKKTILSYTTKVVASEHQKICYNLEKYDKPTAEVPQEKNYEQREYTEEYINDFMPYDYLNKYDANGQLKPEYQNKAV